MQMKTPKEATTILRKAHFLGQCDHESGGFKRVVENLNYSSTALLSVFKRHYTPELAEQHHRKPELIANHVYANRMGNNEDGDGWKYRGRGYLQLTGKENYKLFSDYIGEDCVKNPNLVATKYKIESAAWFFESNKLWEICDRGITNADISVLTRRINGGLNGINHRIERTHYWYNYLIESKKKSEKYLNELKKRS